MLDLRIGALQILQPEFLGAGRGEEALAQDLGSAGADVEVWGCCEREEGGGFYGVFLVGGGWGVRWSWGWEPVDFGEGPDVQEAMGDLLDGDEGEDAWWGVSGVEGGIGE